MASWSCRNAATRTVTQEDPIGLAGGLNLYGFAGGDPINFSDPFGLCPIPPSNCVDVGFFGLSVWDLIRDPSWGNLGWAAADGLALVPGIPSTGLIRRGGGVAADVTRSAWGRAETLGDHFRRHGADFGARSADEYAQRASDFLTSAQRKGLPTKIDENGVIRVYDPDTNTFGAYNPDGTTRTFFKPKRGQAYWDEQPGTAPTEIGGG